MPRAAYHALMSGRLIALEKQPGVRPVGVGETWRRLFDKCVLRVTGPEATSVCQDDQLCAGLKAVIDGAAEDWGFLIADAKNTFNDIILIGMLWTVRHLWPSGDRFVFNCYRHWSSLVLRNGNGRASLLSSR